MSFGNPGILPWFLVLLALGWMRWSYRRWQSRKLSRWAQERFLKEMWQLRRPWRIATSDIALWLGLACVLLALARPQWGKEKSKIGRRGLDLITMLDISESMNAKDVHPSRWQRAVLELHGFCKQLAGDRIALMAFAGEAGLQAPLTDDYTALRELAWQSRPGLFLEKGAGLAQGFKQASELLMRRKNESYARVIVVLSDGISAEDAIQAQAQARALAQKGVFLFLVAIGPRSAALRSVAQAGRGYYLPLQQVGFGLQSVAQAIRSYKRSQRDSKDKNKPIERFPLFVAFGFVLLFASRMLQPL